MNIIDKGLKFKGLRKRRSTSMVVLHHSVSSDVSAVDIDRWHRGQGWLGIGYHFVIRFDGRIERGRPLDTIGSHAGSGINGKSIGICLTGNFMNHLPTELQLRSLMELLAWLKKYYSEHGINNLEVKLLREVAATACPGTLFPRLSSY